MEKNDLNQRLQLDPKTKNILKNQGVPLKKFHLNFPSHSR